jgi:hypothetical protein
MAEGEHRLQHDPAQIGALFTFCLHVLPMESGETSTKTLSEIESGTKNFAPAKGKTLVRTKESIGTIETFDWTNSGCASTLRFVNVGLFPDERSVTPCRRANLGDRNH